MVCTDMDILGTTFTVMAAVPLVRDEFKYDFQE
jgi:hypothetical protein